MISMANAQAATGVPATLGSPAMPATASIKASKKRRGQETSTARLKVVVRRLPPNLPEAIFWQSVEPWMTEESITWRTYYPGKVKPKLERENVPSRAYIMFKTPEQVAQFSGGYNGHVFRDKQGHESQAVVEFAPYQKAPGLNVKPDARQGTIDQDPDFISFLNNLNAPVEHESLASLERGAAQAPEREIGVSPLIEALLQQKKSSKAAKAAKAAAQAPTVASRQAAAVASQQAALQVAQEEKSLYSRRLPGEAGPSNEPSKPKKNKGNSEAQAADDTTRKRGSVVGQMRQFEAALGAAVSPGGQPRKAERTASSAPAPSSSASQPGQPATTTPSGKSKKGKGKFGAPAAQGVGGGPSQQQPRAEPGQGARGRGRGRGAGPSLQAQSGPTPGMIQIAARPQTQAQSGAISRIDMQQPNQPLYGPPGRGSGATQAPIGTAAGGAAGDSGGSDGRPVRNVVAQQMIERLKTGSVGGGGRGRGRGSPGGGRGGAPGAQPS